MTTDLHVLQPLMHANARAKGFYDARDLGTETRMSMTALTHSEISESLECVRKGGAELTLWFYDKFTGQHHSSLSVLPEGSSAGNFWKPEGLPAELADVVIRALDFAFFFNIGFTEPTRRVKGTFKVPSARAAAAWLAELHQAAADEDIGVLIQECYNLASAYGFDLDEAIRLKHAYNTGRDKMHGNKKL